MKVQISWLLQKPTNLDLHCLQRQDIPGFSRTRVNGIWYSLNNNSVTILSNAFRVVIKLQWKHLLSKLFCLPLKWDPLRKHAYSNILKISPPKTESFQIKNSDIFHISAQNIDCGYSLEPPRRGSSKEYPQSMFWAEIRKIMYTPVNPSFTI